MFLRIDITVKNVKKECTHNGLFRTCVAQLPPPTVSRESNWKPIISPMAIMIAFGLIVDMYSAL